MKRCTRSRKDIECFEEMQKGIVMYFEDYTALLPENARDINKGLDEKILSLINKVDINVKDFLNLKVEDTFFGRMTDMKDIVG